MTTVPSSPTDTADVGALGAPTNPDAVASAARLDPSAAAQLPPRRPAWRRAMSTSPFYMGCVLLGLVVVFSILRPDSFPTMANFRTITLDVAMLQIMAVGMTFVMVGGGFDISIGSILVFSGLVAGKMMEGMADNWWTVIAGTIVALLCGIAWGMFNGFCIAKLKVPPLITTLGTLGAALGCAELINDGSDIRTVPTTMYVISRYRPFGLSWLVWIAIGVSVVFGLILAYTRFGRHTYLIGSNIESARRAGINVDRHVMTLYALNGGLAGLAGMVSLTRFSTTTISGHAQDALQVITGVVLGGTSIFGGVGTVIGTAIGILIPAVLTNGFVVMNFQPFLQQVVIGLVLIAAVYLDQLKRRRRER
jgi:ribose transport system permease protein